MSIHNQDPKWIAFLQWYGRSKWNARDQAQLWQSILKEGKWEQPVHRRDWIWTLAWTIALLLFALSLGYNLYLYSPQHSKSDLLNQKAIQKIPMTQLTPQNIQNYRQMRFALWKSEQGHWNEAFSREVNDEY